MWGAAIPVLKPFVLIWVGLNAFDDLAVLIRIGKLGASVIPFPGKNVGDFEELCGVCNDVMEGLMRGSEGLSATPCSAACLGLRKCVRMCERLQEVSAESNKFPCIAAGFCDPAQADFMDDSHPDCKPGAFFSCNPRNYCHRKRQGLKMSCVLKPGIGRWVGMKNTARDHAGALAAGLMGQRHCGEEDAGPYCIAQPRGIGLLAEIIGHFISLVIASLKSIAAIETPGGGDDRQWLTFWLILILLLYIERFFARVVLSTFPFYYQTKLLLMVWLVWSNGSNQVYRKLRRMLQSCHFITSDEEVAKRQLKIMQLAGKGIIDQRLIQKVSTRIVSECKSVTWDYDEDDIHMNPKPDATKQLFELSKYILSAKGLRRLEENDVVTKQNKMLLVERAASVVSFQPRFLLINLMGTKEGPEGQLPPMDRNELADPYVTCRLIPENGPPYPKKGISSKTAYKTLAPQWNQQLEIPLRGGALGSDGFFFCGDAVEATQLEVVVCDSDVGAWYIAHYVFRLSAAILVIANTAAYIRGLSDDMTRDQLLMALSAMFLVAIGFVVSFVMAVLLRSDDEFIGQCTLPIDMLMDQREHTLLLILNEERNKKNGDFEVKKKGNTLKNQAGCGVLRVKMLLSEN